MDNKAGTAFFGIDAKYIAQVQSREISDLVSEGYGYQDLMLMPIAKRRLYYHLMVQRHNPSKEPPPGQANLPAQMQKNSQK